MRGLGGLPKRIPQTVYRVFRDPEAGPWDLERVLIIALLPEKMRNLSFPTSTFLLGMGC